MSTDPDSAGETKPSMFKKVKKAFKSRRGTRRRSFLRQQNIITTDYGTPPRKLPKEIQVTPGTPDSQISAVSGVTGMPEPGISMMASVLPALKSDDSVQSDLLFDSSTVFSLTRKSSTNSIFSPRQHPTKSKSFLQTLIKSTKKKSSWFTKSKYFTNLVDATFATVDIDNSGSIDKKEMYSAILLIHLKLATYMGPAACKPPERQYVESVFDLLDLDKSGKLERNEFRSAMTILCSQITTRVVIQWTMMLMIVPRMSQIILEYLTNFLSILKWLWLQFDKREEFTEDFEHFVKQVISSFWEIMPSKVQELLSTFPVDAVTSIPLTVVSSILGTLLVPLLLLKCDEIFHRLAAKKVQKH